MTNLKEENWEERFDKRFVLGEYPVRVAEMVRASMKHFIREEISRTRTATLESVRRKIGGHAAGAHTFKYKQACINILELLKALQTLPTEDSNEVV